MTNKLQGALMEKGTGEETHHHHTLAEWWCDVVNGTRVMQPIAGSGDIVHKETQSRPHTSAPLKHSRRYHHHHHHHSHSERTYPAPVHRLQRPRLRKGSSANSRQASSSQSIHGEPMRHHRQSSTKAAETELDSAGKPFSATPGFPVATRSKQRNRAFDLLRSIGEGIARAKTQRQNGGNVHTEEGATKGTEEALDVSPLEEIIPVPTREHWFELLPQWLDPQVVQTADPSAMKYSCLVCDRTFERDDLLLAHALAHCNAFPFICTHAGCTQAFDTFSALAVHEAKPHADSTQVKEGESVASADSTKLRRSNRRLRGQRQSHDIRDALGDAAPHCNCGFTKSALSGMDKCCTDDSCPCVIKGVVCVACGCRRCDNKKSRS